MRTTIDIPNELRQKLIFESMARNMKGFSEIIIEALKEHFKSTPPTRKNIIQKLKGCLTRKEYTQEIKQLEKGRNNWRT